MLTNQNMNRCTLYCKNVHSASTLKIVRKEGAEVVILRPENSAPQGPEPTPPHGAAALLRRAA